MNLRHPGVITVLDTNGRRSRFRGTIFIRHETGTGIKKRTRSIRRPQKSANSADPWSYNFFIPQY